MRTRHTLLAGVAALALFAASGIASAQQTQQDQKGGASQSSMHSQRSQQGERSDHFGRSMAFCPRVGKSRQVQTDRPRTWPNRILCVIVRPERSREPRGA